MIEFHILGSTKLRREDGSFDHSFLTGPKRLAILTYLMLARSGGYQRRDKLVAAFWPETGQKNARNALSNMLYHIRNSIGENAVVNRGTEEIQINREKIWCDAVAFEEALDQEKPRKALDLYRDDLLLGFHVADVSNEFQSWLDSERERLRQRAAEAAWLLAEQAEKAGDSISSRTWAKKAVSFTELSEDPYRRLITLLYRMGDRSGALKAYRECRKRLQDEWDMKPSKELGELAKKIRADESAISKKPGDEDEGKSVPTIAVLPFETLGSDQASPFTIGVYGDILTRLSSILDIQVISRTSVRQYAHTQKTAKEIGDELNAAFMLEGDVQESNGRVQLNIRLINAKNEFQVWAQDYRRELTAESLFQIQSEITKEIADALKAKLTPEEKRRVERSPTQNLDAYRLYMQGWSWIEQRTEKGIRRGLDYFRQAHEHDPDFALASVGHALALLALYGYGFEVTENVLNQAEEHVHHAMKQNKELAEAHAALGLLHSERHRGPKAIEELNKAVKIRPGYANAHNKLSWVCQLLGKRIEALGSAKKAVDLDPFSPEAVINLSFTYLINGELEKALHQARRVRELQPNWTTGPFYEGLILYHQQRFNEAQPLLQDLSVEWAGEGPRTVLALCQIATADSASANEHLAYFKDAGDYMAAGLVQAGLGETEHALDALQKNEDWKAWPTHVMHHLFPDILNDLRDRPRFQQAFNRMIESWGMEPGP